MLFVALARAKEYKLKQLKEMNDGASVTSTVVSGWGRNGIKGFATKEIILTVGLFVG